MAIKFWPLWLFLFCILVIKLMLEVVLPREFAQLKTVLKFKKGEQWRNEKDLIRWLRGMKPAEFEEYIADLFRRMEYKTEVVGGRSDGGIDVIAEKNGVKHYIQCKKYFEKHEVGVAAVRDFYGALADRVANGKGYFITTSKFTLEAERFAKDKPIELVDIQRLFHYIRLAEKEKKVPKSPNQEDNKCPICDGNLILRKGKFGSFYGCSNFPKCRYTKN